MQRVDRAAAEHVLAQRVVAPSRDEAPTSTSCAAFRVGEHPFHKGAADAGSGSLAPRVARVTRRWRERPGVWTLEIDVGSSAPFEPGQFNMLAVFGVGEIPISMSGRASRPGRVLHTVRAVGPVSAALARLAPGDSLGVRGPFGAPWPMEALDGRDVLVIAGGLGIAPLRPVLMQLAAERERYGRVALLYGARSQDAIVFHADLERWPRRELQVELTVDRGSPGWTGHVGVAGSLLPLARIVPDRTVALVCGPEIMMRLTIEALLAAGFDATATYLSMERNMQCGVGLCGHCQVGPVLVCRDGPVVRYDRVRDLLGVKEL